MTAFVVIAYLKGFGSHRATVEADSREAAEFAYRGMVQGAQFPILSLDVTTPAEDAAYLARSETMDRGDSELPPEPDDA